MTRLVDDPDETSPCDPGCCSGWGADLAGAAVGCNAAPAVRAASDRVPGRDPRLRCRGQG